MPDHDATSSSTTPGLPVAPSMGPALAAAGVPIESKLVDRRVVVVSGLAIGLGVAAALLAELLTSLIGLVTNLAFYGRLSHELVSPAQHQLGVWVVLVPVAGALVVGVMARYGSQAIRGHGIPEAMEQVITNQSRIPARITFLKPLSAAVAIGTGGPFGAEGPIIATGGALGSLLGQVLRTSAVERKTLLAAGAAAGMSATFGVPVSAVLLAIELLLFELRPRSLVPVALASAAAAGARIALVGGAPVFAIPDLAQPGAAALAVYVLLGALIGLVAVLVTKAVYAIEDGFARLPIHWMWWPALGGLVVGLVGLVAPRTLGVGYDNITDALSGNLALGALVTLCAWKFLSWSIALGSGTSGGTLAPLLTIGGGLGAALGAGAAAALPAAGIDPRVAALVGMAALFAGSSRAVLASIVFAFETTRQPIGLLPLLGGCSAAYLISCLSMRHSIMTEKIARRGVRVVGEYAADFLAQVLVRDVAAREVVSLGAGDPVEKIRGRLLEHGGDLAHGGFPVVDEAGRLVGVVTRRDLFGAAPGAAIGQLVARAPVVVGPDASLREAADHMVREGVGRLVVVDAGDPPRIIGILTRSDLLAAHAHRLREHDPAEPTVRPLAALRR